MLRKYLSPLRFPMISQEINKIVQELGTSDRSGSEVFQKETIQLKTKKQSLRIIKQILALCSFHFCL
ncbi:hypothetical protein J2T17_001771 [Paenibacillus mucilaginosus]